MPLDLRKIQGLQKHAPLGLHALLSAPEEVWRAWCREVEAHALVLEDHPFNLTYILSDRPNEGVIRYLNREHGEYDHAVRRMVSVINRHLHAKSVASAKPYYLRVIRAPFLPTETTPEEVFYEFAGEYGVYICYAGVTRRAGVSVVLDAVYAFLSLNYDVGIEYVSGLRYEDRCTAFELIGESASARTEEEHIQFTLTEHSVLEYIDAFKSWFGR